MSEERKRFVGQEEILVGVRFGKDIIVFVRDGAMNELSFGDTSSGPTEDLQDIADKIPATSHASNRRPVGRAG